MAREDRGMRLSVRGLQLSGLQIVKLDNVRGRDEIFVLKSDTVIESYTYNPLVDVGFTINNSAQEVLNAINLKGENLPTSKIMEIAGGDNIKVRYDNGLSYTCVRTAGGKFIATPTDNVARITSTKEYKVSTPIQYYKTGAGTAPLMALLENNVCAVFEGANGDTKVTIDELMTRTDAIIGKVGGFYITQQNNVKRIVLPSGSVVVTGFGEVVREITSTRDIRLGTQIPSNTDPKVNYSDRFSPAHYQYIQANRNDRINGWSGVGNVGYVVDMGDYAMMDVPISYSNQVGGTLPIPTPQITDTIPFVVEGGIMKKVNTDGTLVAMPITQLQGTNLITHLYTHDMSGELALASATGGEDTEPFSVNGYHFSYSAGHLVDVDVATL